MRFLDAIELNHEEKRLLRAGPHEKRTMYVRPHRRSDPILVTSVWLTGGDIKDKLPTARIPRKITILPSLRDHI